MAKRGTVTSPLKIRRAVGSSGRVVLLVDIGNTHTHAAAANAKRVVADATFPSDAIALDQAEPHLTKLLRLAKCSSFAGAVFCSVVPLSLIHI